MSEADESGTEVLARQQQAREKPLIPKPPLSSADSVRMRFDLAMWNTLTTITAQSAEPVELLDEATADLAAVIAKINEILRRVQRTQKSKVTAVQAAPEPPADGSELPA